MLKKFEEAIHLLFSNFRLISSIILAVWLVRTLFQYFLAHFLDEKEQIGYALLSLCVDWVFHLICVGAVIYALSEMKQGRQVTYSGAISFGTRNWGRLFLARFVSGLLITLGLVAFVIPGVLLLIRYALLDSVVTLERAGTLASMRRSAELTIGVRWQIFGVGLLFFIGYSLLERIVYMPLGHTGTLNSVTLEFILDLVLAVAYSLIYMVMFLFYWEVKDKQTDCSWKHL